MIRIGIAGYGNIGRRVCDVAKAFGMKVLVHTAHPEKYMVKSDKSVGTQKTDGNLSADNIHCFYSWTPFTVYSMYIRDKWRGE